MPSLLKPISRKTESPVTTITVPTSCLPPSSVLCEWLFSYWDSRSPNDSSGAAADSGVVLDSGMLGLDMIRSGRSRKMGGARRINSSPLPYQYFKVPHLKPWLFGFCNKH